DEIDDRVFDFHIAADPTLILKNPIVYKTGRLLVDEANDRGDAKNNGVPIIGSFGFGTPGKGFDRIVKLVQEEFDEAIIRLNIPYARFGDEDGSKARQIAGQCRGLVKKQGISLSITHDYFDKKGLQDFLVGNSINVFLYEGMNGRGIS